MTLEEAKELLDKCDRGEQRDHAFGDTEITWWLDGKEVAGGYFGGGSANVWIDHQEFRAAFKGEVAQQLRKCGAKTVIERNDETGPDEYQEGVTMPGLTLEGVRDELSQA